MPDEDEHWELFIKMMDIVDLLFIPCTSEGHAAHLAVLINDHYHGFRKVYPNSSVIPKGAYAKITASVSCFLLLSV